MSSMEWSVWEWCKEDQEWAKAATFYAHPRQKRTARYRAMKYAAASNVYGMRHLLRVLPEGRSPKGRP